MRCLNAQSIKCFRRARNTAAVTIVEAVIFLALSVLVIAAALGATVEMQISSSRAAQYIAGMAIADAKAQDVRGWPYPGTNFSFTSNSVVTYTNSGNISLNQAGTTFIIPGTVTTKIQYIGYLGHMVTVTAVFQTPRIPMTQTVQTVVNKYTGGQQ